MARKTKTKKYWVIQQTSSFTNERGESVPFSNWLHNTRGLFDLEMFGLFDEAMRFRFRKNAMEFIKQHNLKKCKPHKITL